MALYRMEHSQELAQGDLAPAGNGFLPMVLLLDEATSSLDTDTERQVLMNIKERLRGETCFFISHRPGTLDICDFILVLEGGRVAQFGTRSQVLRRPCAALQWLVSGAIPNGERKNP